MKRYNYTLLTLAILSLLFSPTSFALTVDEVIKLKKTGVSDETIQLMIQHEMTREKLSDPYKNIGVRKVKEPDGSISTIYSTGEIEDEKNYEEESEREKREKAWEMLHNMVIDTRKDTKETESTENKKQE
jgi:oligoendopeptidase F